MWSIKNNGFFLASIIDAWFMRYVEKMVNVFATDVDQLLIKCHWSRNKWNVILLYNVKMISFYLIYTCISSSYRWCVLSLTSINYVLYSYYSLSVFRSHGINWSKAVYCAVICVHELIWSKAVVNLWSEVKQCTLQSRYLVTCSLVKIFTLLQLLAIFNFLSYKCYYQI